MINKHHKGISFRLSSCQNTSEAEIEAFATVLRHPVFRRVSSAFLKQLNLMKRGIMV